MAFYLLAERSMQFDKVLEFVLIMEWLELYDAKVDHPTLNYEIPDLAVTATGFTLKQLEYDYQRNKEELIQTVKEYAKKEDVMVLAEEFPLYIALFHTRKRGIAQFYEWMQTFDSYQHYKKQLNKIKQPFLNIDSNELYIHDGDRIEALIQYPPELILDTPFYEISGHPSILIGYEETNMGQITQDVLEGLVPSEPLQEPLVFEKTEDGWVVHEELFGL